MNEPFLTYGKLRLLNVPGGKPVYDEVLVEDCYRLDQIPRGSIVLDVGGFYGEFGLWCGVERDCFVQMYEPAITNCEVANANIILNDPENVAVYNCAIANSNSDRCFTFDSEHPAGSRFADVSGLVTVRCATLQNRIDSCKTQFGHHPQIIVKLDCEGAEREIFDDESWLTSTHMVLMEFHNKDGQRYKEILERHGFAVDFDDPNPEAQRAIICAKRK